jgi:hypothetical protein
MVRPFCIPTLTMCNIPFYEIKASLMCNESCLFICICQYFSHRNKGIYQRYISTKNQRHKTNEKGNFTEIITSFARRMALPSLKNSYALHVATPHGRHLYIHLK